MKLRTLILSSLAALTVASCGGGGGLIAGGIGGTGVSFGPILAFGSVVVNGVEYDTSSADFSVEGSSAGIDQGDLSVGMMVTVTHDDNGNAKSVTYRDNVEGPVSNRTATTFDVLGVTITVSDTTVYENTTGLAGADPLADDDIVEVSGQVTGDNAVLATRVERKGTCATLGAGDEIEVKGTITSIVDADTFTIGSLTIDYAGGTTALNVGDYVEVKSDDCPVGNTITATSVESETEGPDLSDLDEDAADTAEMELNGVVAELAVDAGTCDFTVNGQAVSATDADFENGAACADLSDGMRVEVEGSLDGGTLVADSVSLEDENETVASEYTDWVTVNTHPTAFTGTIMMGSDGPFTVDLTTTFESETTQDFNLDTMAATPTCATVKVNASDAVISIEEHDSGDCI